MQREIVRAIAAGEFSVHYQPRFSASTLLPVSAEALVRRTGRPEVTPDQFIPRMEADGSIEALTAFVAKTVCQDIQRIKHNLGIDANVSINISPALFRNDLFATRLVRCIALHNIHPTQIEMEITESPISPNLEGIFLATERLHKNGHKIALDDFGKGMSSLHYLDILPVSVIKIDRHFVKQIGQNHVSERIMTSMLSLVRELGMRSVVEGVETVGQQNFVQNAGCDEIQGFLLAKPMDFASFLVFMSQYFPQRPQHPQHQAIAMPQLHSLSPEGC